MIEENVLTKFLDKNGKLKKFPCRRKMKIYALIYLSTKFEYGKVYNENEVNEIINNSILFDDAATVRRELFGYHFLDRVIDGSKYWLNEVQPNLETLLK